MAFALSAVCAGCEHTGGGFRAEGPELSRLREVLALETGKAVADVGAGKGELTLALAKEVGAKGRVYSSEIDPGRLRRLRGTVAAARLGNVTVVEARSSETGLPANCCDAIVLRRVYHHLTEPAGINASLYRALRPGGVLAVVDFPPPFFWSRGSLGIPSKDVIREMTPSGFRLVRLIEDWPGRGPLASYCAVFQKPL